MTMIISGSDGLEFPDGSDQGTAFTGNAATITSGTIATARLATGTANSSTYLRGDQTWAAVPAATPGGSTTQVQYNNAGAFGGSANLVWDNSNVRLGIGTASPSVRLHANVESSSEVDVARFQASNGADVQFLDVGADATNNLVSFDVTGSSSGSYVFRSGGTERMRIDSSGRVGIGTASPSSLLDVNTSAAGNFVARITNNSGAGSTDHALLVETSTASAAKIISARNAGVERFLVTGAGDVSVFNSFLMNSGYGSAAIAYGCRAWVAFNASSGSPSIDASGNISSIGDNGAGDFTLNFTTAMPDANYAPVGMSASNTGTTSGGLVLCVRTTSATAAPTTKTTSALRVLFAGTGNGVDAATINVAVFR
jgi:hypothetical protein